MTDTKKISRVLNPGRSEEELLTIRTMFEENDDLVYAIRNFFLEFGMTDEQKKLVENLTPIQKQVLEDEFLPHANENEPIGTPSDVWAAIDYSGHPEDVYPKMLVREKAINYLRGRFNELSGGKSGFTLQSLGTHPSKLTPLEAYVNHSARLTCIAQVDKNLIALYMTANTKPETIKEGLERIRKNSSR